MTVRIQREYSPGLMSEAVPQRTWLLAFALVCVVAAFLSLISYAGQMPAFVPETQLDKVIHFGIGGGLAVTLDGCFRRRTLASVPLAMPAVIIPAGVEEWMQRYSNHRTSSVGDFVADVLGVVFCTYLARRWLD